jgi:putative transposase
VLAAYVGEHVTIRYDPGDLAEIRVFHGEAFLCRAICPELAGQTIALRDITAARNARRRALRQGIRYRTTVVDQLLAVHHPDYDHPVHGPETRPAELAEPPAPRHSLKLYRED